MSDMINLDAFDKVETKTKDGTVPTAPNTTATVEETGLVVSSKPAVPIASRSLADIYTEKQKLVYLIDVSGSMMDIVAGSGCVAMYEWSEHDMRAIKQHIEDAINTIKTFEDQAARLIANLLDGNDEATVDSVPVPDPDVKIQAWASLSNLQGDDLKVAIIQKGLDKELYLRRSMQWQDLVSKIGLVKRMASRMVEARYEKYPDADIMCLTFDTSTTVLPFDSKEALIKGIAGIHAAGGTNIYQAIDDAIKACRRRPSSVNLHHLVLVTDGEDRSALNLPDLLPTMKENGIVLDFIYIRQPQERDSDRYAAAVKKVVEATGGTYTEVTDANDFERKFIDASTRLMLPPASGQ